MTVVRNTRKAGALYGGRTAKPLDLESPEVRPFDLRKEVEMGRTRGNPDEGEAHGGRSRRGRALEVRKLGRADAPDLD